MSEVMNSKLKIGIIGVGNAGNQAANLAYESGYRALLINSSQKDIDTSLVNEKISAFLLLDQDGQARGCGKERRFGLSLMSNNARRFVENERFKAFADGLDVIIITGSTAGGTGSGAIPYLADLLNRYLENVIVIIHAIIPKIDEAVGAQMNTVGFMQDLESYRKNGNEIPYMISDLNRYATEPNEVGYAAAAENIVECMNIIRGDYFHMSPHGMIDERDMEKIISQPGYMCMNHIPKIKRDELDTSNVQDMMIEHLTKSVSVLPQRDKIVKQIGVGISMPSTIEEVSKTGNYDIICKNFGNPINTFENYYPSNETYGETVLIMSGMSFPYDRFAKCAEKIEEHADILKKAHQDGERLLKEASDKTIGIFDNLQKSKVYGSSSNAEEAKKNFVFGAPIDF